MTECKSSKWYDRARDKLFVNIDDNNWIETPKELSKVCVWCDSITDCQKFSLFHVLLSSNLLIK